MTADTSTQIIALDQSFADTAGALVWWSLTGYTDVHDIADALQVCGLPDTWSPTAPRVETVARRAISAVARGKRELVRPLKTRGSFDLIAEHVAMDGDGEAADEQLKYVAQVRTKVVEVLGQDGVTVKQVVVVPTSAADVELATAVANEVPRLGNALTPNDISVWLLGVLDGLHAVSLRPRGGMYFIPAGAELEQWRQVVRALQAVSEHTMYSMPAVKSDDAVEAILAAVKREADAQFSALEEYLLGTPTTRGINAYTKSTEAMQVKITRYADLLGANLDPFQDRATNLLGLLVVARIKKDGAID